MKNRKGFTLVELLAVIVILAIILVIAVPQILKTIESARLGAFRSTAKLLLSQAEKQYLVDSTLGSANITAGYADKAACSKLAKLDGNYANCKITVANPATEGGDPVIKLNLSGDGKFAGYGCKDVTSSSDVDDDNKCAKGVTASFS